MSVSLRKNRTTTRRPAEAIDTTPVSGTDAELLSRSTEVIDAAEDVIADAEAAGDLLLLDAAGREKIAKVGGTGQSSLQRHQARAWTSGGQVD